ncbi:LFA3 protein, partial [Psilopogon haemacephalus]|nr:LFA3 protein [Psilopogon haemacephalus]
CEMQYGIEGENFTFEVKVDQHMSEIIWKKEKDRVVEWEWQDQVRYLNSLQGRAFLNKENGSLTIFNLQKNDAGTYVLEYLDSERKIKSLTHVLSVIGPFSEPEISCNITANDTKLRCTTDFHLPVSYTWEIDSMTSPSEAQEISISKNHNPSTRVKCSIKFSQTEKSSQINLTQCSQ